MTTDPISPPIELGDKFRDKFVGFIDILGFKQLVLAAEKGNAPSLAELIQFTACLGSGDERQRFEKHAVAALDPGSLTPSGARAD
jgi:hypothetical protein